jgi:FtsZ-binding cell division protein ZapB
MNELDVQNKQKAKDRRNNIIVIALSVVLVVVVVLYLFQMREHRAIVSEINEQKDSIQFELTQISTSYDSLKTENDTINEQLTVAQTKVKDLLLEVEQTKKISYQKISDYQKQVNTLRGIMKNFVVQIDSLNRRNQELMAENLEVKEQYKKVESKNQQLSQEKQRLQQTVDRAAMLKARELVVEPLNSRSKPTRYASRAEKIRIYFVLSSNPTAKRGSKNIYARITRPDQLVLSKSSDNLFQFEDVKIQYSAMRDVNYEGQELPVAIFWDNTNEPELMKGDYSVDVFADGNIIGETKFEIR